MDRQTLRHVPQAGTALVALVILYATLTPSPGPPRWLPAPAIHFLLFAGLGAPAALWYATSEGARRAPQRVLAMSLLALWLFAGLTEVAQGLVGRTPDLADLALDLAGAVTGFLAGGAVWRVLLGRVPR